MQQKDAEQRLLQRQVQILLQENKSYLQDLEEEKKRSPLEVRRGSMDAEQNPLFPDTLSSLKYVGTQLQTHQFSAIFVVVLCPFLQTEHYLEQQMSIRRLRQNLLAARTLLLEAGAPGTADDSSQSVCLTSHGCKYETTRRVGTTECFHTSNCSWWCFLF